MAFFSSHGKQDYWDLPFEENMLLIFGKESVGLPKDLIHKHEQNVYKIPIHSPHIRSINLANAVGVVVYEGLRQLVLNQ